MGEQWRLADIVCSLTQPTEAVFGLEAHASLTDKGAFRAGSVG